MWGKSEGANSRSIFCERANPRSVSANSGSIFYNIANPKSESANSWSINFCELTMVLKKLTLDLKTFI